MNTKHLQKSRWFGAAILIGIISAGVLFFQPGHPIVHAQESQGLDLSLSRDFGYSSGTGSIQGTFSMKISSSQELQKVVFYIDDTAIGEDNQAPFQFQFSTDHFSLGDHTIHALGYTSDGKEFSSNEIRVQFVSANEGWQAAIKIAVPIIGLSFGAILISFALPFLFRRGKSKRVALPERFGILGGAICPKCGLPFNIPVLKINLLVGSLLPCPYCGKWSIVRHASPAELQAALEASKAQQNPDASLSRPEETSQKEIDDSRYMNL
jgi:hypothetical protein